MDGERGKQQIYLAYMLRLWQAGSRDGLPVWRASLENPHTGERLAFGDAESMFAFLADLMADLARTTGPTEKTEPASNEGIASSLHAKLA